MNITLALKEMSAAEKIGLMEEIWSDFASPKGLYSPPDWHENILRERIRQADAGEVGYTDCDMNRENCRSRKTEAPSMKKFMKS